MKISSELDILMAQYEIVHKHQQDSNTRLFQVWIGFGAIITGTGVLIATNQQSLLLLAPLGFILWFFLLGMMTYDNHYRQVFLSFLENEINRRAESALALLTFESYASPLMWKFSLRSRIGLPSSMIWLTLNLVGCLTVYVLVCIIALRSLPAQNWFPWLLFSYSIPVIVFLLLLIIIVPAKLRKFSDCLQNLERANAETIVS